MKTLTSLRSSSMRRFLVAYNVGWAQGEGSLQWRFRSKPINEHLKTKVVPVVVIYCVFWSFKTLRIYYSGAHGSVVTGVRPVTKRLQVRAPLWWLDIVMLLTAYYIENAWFLPNKNIHIFSTQYIGIAISFTSV